MGQFPISRFLRTQLQSRTSREASRDITKDCIIEGGSADSIDRQIDRRIDGLNGSKIKPTCTLEGALSFQLCCVSNRLVDLGK